MTHNATRDAILARLRRSNQRSGPPDAAISRENDARMARHGRNLLPERAKGDHDALVARFTQMAEEAFATVVRVAPDGVPQAVADYLAQSNLGAALVMAPDPALDAYPWAEQSLLTIRRGAPEEPDRVSLTPALAGVAETGSLLVHSGEKTPYALHFMPPCHIAVLPVSAIVGAYEDGWDRLRAHCDAAGEPFPPRAATLITGPSRTSDIEKTLFVGMHGPQKLHIILVDGETA